MGQWYVEVDADRQDQAILASLFPSGSCSVVVGVRSCSVHSCAGFLSRTLRAVRCPRSMGDAG